MNKYTIVHTRSTYTNVHRYVTSGNVHVTGYRITPAMQRQLSPMNGAYITGNSLSDILILHTPTRPTYTNNIVSLYLSKSQKMGYTIFVLEKQLFTTICSITIIEHLLII